MNTRTLAAALAGAAFAASLALTTGQAAQAATRHPVSASRLTAMAARAVHADDGGSVRLPGGREVFLGGDSTWANGRTTLPYYPHQTMTRLGRHGMRVLRFGNGFQPVPNDGTFWYWAGGAAVYRHTLYVFLSKDSATTSGTAVWAHGAPWLQQAAGGFTFDGAAVAEFSARTLRWERTVPLQVMENVDGAVRAGGSWFVFATSGSPWKQGDVAQVPAAGLGTPQDWHWHTGVMPSSLGLGTTVSAMRAGTGWVAFTKQWDTMGHAIERLSAPSPLGPWTVTATWPLTMPAGQYSYSVQAHPEMPAPAGKVLVSWADTEPYNWHFAYLAK